MPTPAIQVCQPGYDVRTCPDWAYLFNSDWPSLAIVLEKTVTINPGDFGKQIPHTLGFPPLAMGWVELGGLSYGRIANVQSTTNFVSVTTNGALTVPVNVTVRCYNIDISKEATYTLPKPAQAQFPYNKQFGMKLAKNNRAITSSNLNDFILHTRAQSPAVLDVATERGKYADLSGFPYSITYPLQTSYIPWVLGAVGFPDNDNYLYYTISSLRYNSATNSLMLPFGEVGAVASLIILRDPLFYPSTVRVVY